MFHENLAKHIPIPSVPLGKNRDETGCGDQTTAALAVSLQTNEDIYKAAQVAVLAGTLQFGKPGIDPVTREELKRYQR